MEQVAPHSRRLVNAQNYDQGIDTMVEADIGRISENLAKARRVIQEYEQFFNSHDAASMNRLFTDDAVFVNFSGTIVQGRMDLMSAQSFVFRAGGPLHNVKVKYDIQCEIPINDDVTVIHSLQSGMSVDGTVLPLGQDVMRGVLMVLLVRTSEGWRIKVGQNTPIKDRQT